MPKEMLIEDTDLKFAAYYVIKQFRLKTGDDPTGLYFNKAMSIINSKMKEDGYNLRLPHCWYRWGDEVVRYCMPFELGWSHEDPPFTKVTWEGEVPYGMIDVKVQDRVKTLATELAERYSSEEISEMVEQVYRNAPFEFQRRYKSVRDSFLSIQRTEFKVENFNKRKLIPQLVEAIESFPDDKEFDEVKAHLPAFQRLMTYVLTTDDVNYPLANEISEEFWFWFCYFLRLHPSCHENVGIDALAIWTERLQIESERYARTFGDHVLRASKTIPEIASDDVLMPFVATEQDIEKESGKILAEFEGEFEGLDEFLTKVKSNYKAK